MRFVLFAIFICLTTAANATDPLSEGRKLYLSNPTKAQLAHFIEHGDKDNAGSAVISAYKGSAVARMAEFSYNPYTKWSYFKEGQSLIEEAVQQDNQNPEIRFIRFSVQVKTPSFLSYNGAVEEDQKLMISALTRGWLNENPEFRTLVATFLLDNGKLEVGEIELLKKLKSA